MGTRKSLTGRERFERWATRQKLATDTTYEVTRNGPRMMYVSEVTRKCWQAWQARGRIT